MSLIIIIRHSILIIVIDVYTAHRMLNKLFFSYIERSKGISNHIVRTEYVFLLYILIMQ